MSLTEDVLRQSIRALHSRVRALESFSARLIEDIRVQQAFSESMLGAIKQKKFAAVRASLESNCSKDRIKNLPRHSDIDPLPQVEVFLAEGSE